MKVDKVDKDFIEQLNKKVLKIANAICKQQGWAISIDEWQVKVVLTAYWLLLAEGKKK